MCFEVERLCYRFRKGDLDLKLHLGCGKRYLPGYFHIDAIPYPHVNLVADVGNLAFPTDSVEEIYLCHVLEHFPRNRILNILLSYNRILKEDGVIRVAVPDFEACVKRYNGQNLHELLGLLVGGQKEGQFDFHSMIFDFNLLKLFLENSGFCDVALYSASDFLPHDFDDYSKAYLPHLDSSGLLMSLNVQARKGKCAECDIESSNRTILDYAMSLKKQYA
jgi:predicted SAM-dependent methyltransferase